MARNPCDFFGETKKRQESLWSRFMTLTASQAPRTGRNCVGINPAKSLQPPNPRHPDPWGCFAVRGPSRSWDQARKHTRPVAAITNSTSIRGWISMNDEETCKSVVILLETRVGKCRNVTSPICSGYNLPQIGDMHQQLRNYGLSFP